MTDMTRTENKSRLPGLIGSPMKCRVNCTYAYCPLYKGSQLKEINVFPFLPISSSGKWINFSRHFFG